MGLLGRLRGDIHTNHRRDVRREMLGCLTMGLAATGYALFGGEFGGPGYRIFTLVAGVAFLGLGLSYARTWRRLRRGAMADRSNLVPRRW
jgi:hypothetical protein